MTFGDKLKEIRFEQSLTQAEFAEILGVSAPTIISLEKNTKKPSYDTLVKISKEFSVSLDWLCGDDKFSDYRLKNWSDVLKLVYPLLSYEHFNIRIKRKSEELCEGFREDYLSIEIPRNIIDRREQLYSCDVVVTRYDECNPNDYDIEGGLSDFEMFGCENPLYTFIVAFKKMSNLLADGNIDDEVFDLWLEKEIDKNNFEIWPQDKSSKNHFDVDKQDFVPNEGGDDLPF